MIGKNNKGIFLSIEGIDGSGTTTQTRVVKKELTKLGYDVKVTNEPFGDQYGVCEAIRSQINNGYAIDNQGELALLFAANRLHHYNNVIKPWLDEGCIVISDRYVHSSIVYQSVNGLDEEWIKTINRYAGQPDIVAYLNTSVEVCMERLNKRDKKDSFENLDFQKKVNKRYNELFNKFYESDLLMIDEMSVDNTADVIKNYLVWWNQLLEEKHD